VPIVEKGLVSTRPAAKQKALEAILLYIELDKPDPIIEEILPLLSHKQPKIIATTLSALTSIYHAYGCKIVEPKPTLKLLPKVFGHADKNVRAEAQNLTVEFYRWLRDAMKPFFWNDLKPVQQQDLEKTFEKVKNEPPPKQERLLRSQQDIQESTHGSADDHGVVAYEEEADIDLEPEYEAVNVMPKIPKDLQERLSSSKWKDRKDALDDLHQAINHPRIEEGPFDDILRALAKCMKDANIAVVSIAANCVEILANGLKKSFSKYRAIVVQPMMERLKEKKQTVTDALGAALDAVLASTSLADCLDDILEFLKHKNPQVKIETTRFLIRSLSSIKEAPQPPEVKPIADAATKLLTESQEVQRNAGAEVLGILWKIMGDRIMAPHMEGLDDIRKSKIKEYCDKAEVKAKYRPKTAGPPAKAAVPAPAQRRMGPTAMPGTGAPTGKKPPMGLKKPASIAVPPPAEEPPTAPLAPRPTTRPGVSKLPSAGGAPKSGIANPGGLRPPAAGLQKKTPGIPGPSTTTASPVRKLASPFEEPPPTAAVSQPKLGLGPNRGLAGRPLGKPISSQPNLISPDTIPTTASGLAGLSTAERAELEELRAETTRLTRENELLRSEKAKLASQIHELTNQNAQLIEDHTRDVLSVKAKETQLIRARTDFEEVQAQVATQQREMDRLKRELSRQVRASSPAPLDLSEQIYNDGLNGTGVGGYGRVRNYGASPTSPGKENDPVGATAAFRTGKLSGASLGGGVAATGLGISSTFGTGSPRAMRATGLMTPDGVEVQRTHTTAGERSSVASTSSVAASGGAESWKRAAEVTQNLKARIEMMKVSSWRIWGRQ
jgi:cytoskeleton-associated protein 5